MLFAVTLSQNCNRMCPCVVLFLIFFFFCYSLGIFPFAECKSLPACKTGSSDLLLSYTRVSESSMAAPTKKKIPL